MSTNWSGQIDLGTTYTAVGGEWTVPTVVPSTSEEFTSTWIGIGGVGTHSLIQTGTDEITSTDRTAYGAWYELLPKSAIVITEPVSPGDTMLAVIRETATNKWNISIKDVTKGWVATGTVTYIAGSATSAEWITERPVVTGHLSTLADYGSTRFHDLGMSGTDIAITKFTASYMVNTTAKIISYPGNVYTTTTSDFTDYYGTPLPTVTSVSPSQGSTAGGTSVTITGTYIFPQLLESVHFGTDAASVTSKALGSITATAPAQREGTVNVTITTTDGTSAVSSADHFTYITPPTVSSLSPKTGPTSGGTTVTIAGSNFTGATAVKFGTTGASFRVTSATKITATSPAGSGTVNVTVTAPGGTSAVSSADRFTYVAPPPPIVSSVSPTTGLTIGGTTVVITGTNFTDASSVKFGSTSTSFTVTSARRITATSPPGSGTVNVTVTTPGGTSPVSSADQFTYVAPPPLPASSGYDLVGSDGGVFVFPTGSSGGFYGSLPGLTPPVHVNDIVGMVATSNDQGYFLVGADGGVFSFGNAPFLGSLPGLHVTPAQPITGIVPTGTDGGYFLVGKDGGVYAFGNAPFLGSLPGSGVHTDNVVGIAATPSGNGYWLVTATGTVYAYGAAKQLGSATGTSSPVTAIAGTPTGGGYWIVTQNGSVDTFGNAKFFGSLPGLGVTPAEPVIGIVHTARTSGYWLIGSDGGIFAVGTAPFVGSLPGLTPPVHVTDIVGAVPTTG